MNNKWFVLNFRKKFLDFRGNKYWTSGRKTQQESQNWTQQVPENSLVFAISFSERERTSVRNVNWNWLLWFKKVTTCVRLIFLHFVKKAKINNATNTWLFCIPNRGKHAIQKDGNVLFGKKLLWVSKNWKSEAFCIFWRFTITGGKKVALKKKTYVKTVQRWCFDTISSLYFKFAYLFDKDLYITLILRPFHAIIQWNNFRRQAFFSFFNCFAMLSEKFLEKGNMESNPCSLVQTALYVFRGLLW